MDTEQTFTDYVFNTRYEELPGTPIAIAKNLILTVVGTTIAGAKAEGCEPLVNLVRQWGGREESTILVHGGKVPAHNAAFVNSVMARALDYCDAMTHGLHMGSSAIPTALAAAELAGGCSGKEFLTALVLGVEMAARLNAAPLYDGFDATGVCGAFGATAIAGRILRLNSHQMMNALGLAFNRAAGSYQSNVEGTLAVRVIQGFTSQTGIISAQLAQAGITGPKKFLEGVYGYFHLYIEDAFDRHSLTARLNKSYEMEKIMFKKYPSCGCTLGPTDAVLEMISETDIAPSDVACIDVRVNPHVHKMVGSAFEIGPNPKVNAQFSLGYCVANALLRKSSKLRHFDEAEIRDPRVLELAKLVRVTPDESLENYNALFSIAGTEVKITTKTGEVLRKMVDVPRGGPGLPLTQTEHLERLRDCIDYAGNSAMAQNIERILLMIDHLEETENVLSLVPLLLGNEVNMAGSAPRQGRRL